MVIDLVLFDDDKEKEYADYQTVTLTILYVSSDDRNPTFETHDFLSPGMMFELYTHAHTLASAFCVVIARCNTPLFTVSGELAMPPRTKPTVGETA